MSNMTPKRSIMAAALLATVAATPAVGSPAVAEAVSPALSAGVRADTGGLDTAGRSGLVHRVDNERGGSGKSPAEAAREARREHGGKVLSVSREGGGKQAHYRVKLIDNGNVRVVRIPVR